MLSLCLYLIFLAIIPFKKGAFMLKFIAKLFVFLLFVFSVSIESGGKLKGEGLHTFYFYSKSSSAKIKTLPETQANSFIYLKNSLKGESVTFSSKEGALNLLSQLNAKSVFSEEGTDFYCEYYYSEQIKNYIMLNGKRVNLHLSCNDGLFCLGSPIIFGSF